MLAHVPSFGRNPRGSPDFLAYPVPKACMHVLGTMVPRRLGVARSASSPKAAQALGCSLTPGLRISFGRVTCMARAQCPGYGHWFSYCCVVFVCGSGLCLGSGFGCAPPLLAGVLGWVCVCVPAPLVPRHSWLGCAVWVCVLGLGFRLRPATPGWGVGVCACSCARSACTPPLLAGVCGALRLYPATPGWGVRRGCVCFGLGFGCAPPLLAGVLGCVCARAPAPLVPRHSWLGCAAWVCVLWLGFRLRPATPGWGVGVFVCSCVHSACTPPLLAGVCGALRLYPATPGWGVRCGCVCFGLGFGCAPPLLAGVLGCVCARAPAPLVPRHSWLGCAAWVCVLWLGFRLRPATPGWGVGVCACSCARSACTPPPLAGVRGALRLYPATPGWGVRRWCVCFGLGFGCAPPLLAGVLGCVCARAPAPLVPRHSWLGCAAWVCVLWLGFRLRPATPGWGVRRAPLVPRHSWLGCAAWVCVLWLGFRLRPATPGWGVGVCVCSCARSACTPPLLAGVCGVGVCALAWVSAAPRHSWLGCWGVCVLVRPLRLYPATPGWGVRRGCVCFGLGFGCAPPLLAGVLGCVRVRVRPPLVPRHSWLGCAARSACTPPLLAGVCRVGVCALAWVSAAPRHSWLGC